MAAVLKTLQEKLEHTAVDYRNCRKEMTKSMQNRSQYMQQQQENQMVMKELDVLEEDAAVYKLVGPMLIKQDLMEAKSNVSKRLEYIGGEIKRMDGMIKSQQNKERETQDEMIKLQKKMQQLAQQGKQ